MPRICGTRALKNARHLQKIAPDLVPADEPAAGFGSLIPFDILSSLHLKKTIPGRPDLKKVLADLPKPQNVALDPLFNGTLHLVKMTFTTSTAPAASGNTRPTGYMFDAQGTQHLIYVANNNNICELHWDSSGWHFNDLTSATGAPRPASRLCAYVFNAQGTQHVDYIDGNGHVWELWWDSSGWHAGDLTNSAGAPAASTATTPTGYAFEAQGTQHVDYIDNNGHVWELWWDSSGWHAGDLTNAAGAPPAASSVCAYVFNAQGTQHVDYIDRNGHVWELWWDSSGWHAGDLTNSAGAPAASTATTPTGYAFEAQGTQHVDYIDNNGHVWELWWDSSGWHAGDLTNAVATMASISDSDVATMLAYCNLAAPKISAYASQYGPNSVSVSQNIIEFSVNVPTGSYNDQTLQGWVNTIASQNSLPNSDCIIVFNPIGVTNTDGTGGILGYHDLANLPYCFVNVFGNSLNVQDQADAYALQLSHEIGEMTVDPTVNGNNPEVCDPCGPNCAPTWRDFFVNNAYSQTGTTFPPGFAFTYFINAIVQPNSATSCPAPSTACNYAPPGSWHFNDLTDAAGALGARDDTQLSGYVFEAQGTQHVDYVGINTHVCELWWDNSGWHFNDLANAANVPEIETVFGLPAYVFNAQGTQHVFYLGSNGHVCELCWDSMGWHFNDVTAATGAPGPSSELCAYVFNAQGTQHVDYLDKSGHIWELWRDSSGWHSGDLTNATGAAAAATAPIGYMFDSQGTQHVDYVDKNGHICELWWDGSGWHFNDLTSATGAPHPASGLCGYVFNVQGTQHIDYVDGNGHICELWWDNLGWHFNDLTNASAAPTARRTTPTGYVFDAQGTQHVIYVANNGHICELWWDNTGWHFNDLANATGAPNSMNDTPVTGYMFKAQETQHVIYIANNAVGNNGHICELWWG
jgi:hypothetical protein